MTDMWGPLRAIRPCLIYSHSQDSVQIRRNCEEMEEGICSLCIASWKENLLVITFLYYEQCKYIVYTFTFN